MRAYMRGDPRELHNKCVFYTRLEDRPNAPKRLSGRATQWACNYDKFSIWHLWPNALIVRGDSSHYKNFFGIYLEGNWLKKIQELPRYISPPQPETQYFENMSEAMAQTCTGEVIIMTEDPTNFNKFSQRPNNLYNDAGNIWGNKERPALRNSHRAGPSYLVDVTSWSTGNENFPVYDYDIDTQDVTRRTTPPWRTMTQSVDGEGGSNSTDAVEAYGHLQYTNVNYPFPVDPPNVPLENETGSYLRKFAVPRSWDLQKYAVRLRFEGVDSSHHVYIDSTEIGYSQGSRSAAKFDITGMLQDGNGAVNTIVVQAYKYCDGTYIDDQDQLWLSGIFRDVYLIAFPRDGISDFTITTNLDNTFTHADTTATVEIHGTVANARVRVTCELCSLSAVQELDIHNYLILGQ
ncbi:galactose-binding domain-like protein [Aspergillus granulosus]|uniref:beta-galactosidase n=1 Tax=Aspergillus granulosus TaxID=176169 RepID=A0ABR4H161_9EURO